jgi:hypothetical protein
LADGCGVLDAVARRLSEARVGRMEQTGRLWWPVWSRKGPPLWVSCLCRLQPARTALVQLLGCRPVWTQTPVEPWPAVLWLASSHTGRIYRSDDPWLRRFRAAFEYAWQRRQLLLAVRGTAAFPWTQRAVALRLAPLWVAELRRSNPATMARRVRDASRHGTTGAASGQERTLFVGPALGSTRSVRGDHLPEPDLLAAVLADEVVVIALRPGGRLAAVLRLLAGLSSEAAPRVIRNLFAEESSCRSWPSGPVFRGHGWVKGRSDSSRGVALVPIREVDTRDFLFHWTRATYVPWPGESREERWDRLLLGTGDSTALGTLRRILTSGVLRASRVIRGGPSAVCFSAMDLNEWPQRRCYRPHRGRYDFELYGLAVRKQRLLELGALPVTYGWPPLEKVLSGPTLAYVQKLRAAGPESKWLLDWSIEGEWRLVGDLPLNRLLPSDAFCFVATRAEAEQIASDSPWPVAYFSEEPSVKDETV